MPNRELDIIRFTDGVMTTQEKNIFLAQGYADPSLREELQTENIIQKILRDDAHLAGNNAMIPTTPGAPLLERLAATRPVSGSKKILIALLSIAILAIIAFFLLRTETPENIISQPASRPSVEQPIPASTPAQPVPEDASHSKQTAQPASKHKGSIEQKNPQQKDIDLDQDLRGKPKVFTDPKGHMPIK